MAGRVVRRSRYRSGEEAWRILRVFLQLLGDRIDEAAHLAAQLPLVLRGVFYEGFGPGHAPEKELDRDAFLARLADGARRFVIASRRAVRWRPRSDICAATTS